MLFVSVDVFVRVSLSPRAEPAFCVEVHDVLGRDLVQSLVQRQEYPAGEEECEGAQKMPDVVGVVIAHQKALLVAIPGFGGRFLGKNETT